MLSLGKSVLSDRDARADILSSWGQQPFFQEFDSDANPLWEIHFGIGDVEACKRSAHADRV